MDLRGYRVEIVSVCNSLLKIAKETAPIFVFDPNLASVLSSDWLYSTTYHKRIVDFPILISYRQLSHRGMSVRFTNGIRDRGNRLTGHSARFQSSDFLYRVVELCIVVPLILMSIVPSLPSRCQRSVARKRSGRSLGPHRKAAENCFPIAAEPILC